MDFGKPHAAIENAISKSNIRLLDPLIIVPAADDKPTTKEEQTTTTTNLRQQQHDLDHQVICASNQVATELILGAGGAVVVPTAETAWRLDTSLMTTRLTEPASNHIIKEGDLVVIQESFNCLDFVYCTSNQVYANRNGSFRHNDIIGQPYGTKLRSRDFDGFAFCYLLKPTPELWTQSLNHRTQVIHELDQSQITWQLQLQPNDVVVESGTGSGALSHSILRAIAPHGHLHTYEFNHHRSVEARKEFGLHGLSHLVTVYHKDVCRGKTTTTTASTTTSNNNDTDGVGNNNTASSSSSNNYEPPGFYQDAASVHAVVLDLPEPWWAVPHAAYILQPDGRIASYSPCVEQTQRTIMALEKAGFHSIQTLEYRLRQHYVDEFEQVAPPSRRRETKPAHDPSVYKDMMNNSIDNNDNLEDMEVEKHNTATTGSKKRRPGSDPKDELDQDQDVILQQQLQPPPPPPANEKMSVARPFTTIQGHTAFLTFATAGLLPQPNPNAADKTT